MKITAIIITAFVLAALPLACRNAYAEVFWGDRVCSAGQGFESTPDMQLAIENSALSLAFDGKVIVRNAPLKHIRTNGFSEESWMVARHAAFKYKGKSGALTYSTQYIGEDAGYIPFTTHLFLTYGGCFYSGLSRG